MKKCLAVLAAMLMMICTAIPAFAMGVPSDNDGDVHAKYVGDFKNIYMADLDDAGAASIVLPDGREFLIESSDPDDIGLRVVITPVTAEETDAYAYVSDAVADAGNEFCAWHIAFYRGDVRVEPQGNVSISIPFPNGYEDAVFYYLNGERQYQTQDADVRDGRLVFATKKNGCYVLVRAKDADEPERDEPGQTAGPSNPSEGSQTGGNSQGQAGTGQTDPAKTGSSLFTKTGDGSLIGLWTCVAAICAGGIVILLRKRRQET